ncbi:hypothetical protein [Rhizobium sp. FKY42]|uniref:hypothetical protein n=1 Tax=Rhizobium sp. FKY42 TaxID=2562310 RepID=UPI0010BF88AA|nr:hypothetical protein [Rhizobium sp. FKY42]
MSWPFCFTWVTFASPPCQPGLFSQGLAGSFFPFPAGLNALAGNRARIAAVQRTPRSGVILPVSRGPFSLSSAVLTPTLASISSGAIAPGSGALRFLSVIFSRTIPALPLSIAGRIAGLPAPRHEKCGLGFLTCSLAETDMQNALFYALKAGQCDLIERCGGIDEVALLTGYSRAQVGRWNNQHAPDLMGHLTFPVLERICGEAIITAIFAAETGRTLSDPVEPVVDDEACVMATMANFAMASAQVQQHGAAVFADEEITPAKADALAKKVKLLQRAASALQRCTAAIKAKGGLRNRLKNFRKKKA